MRLCFTRPLFYKTITVLLFSSLFFSCQNDQETNAAAAGAAATEKHFTMAMVAEPETFDPTVSSGFPAALIQLQVFSGLFQLNEDMSITPQLVDSYDTPDDLTWRFTLKQGVMFHDGSELTADDVVFSLQRAFESPISQNHFKLCESVTAADRYTVEIKTLQSFPHLISKLTAPQALITSRAQYELDDGQSLVKQPIGTGPYKFVEWLSGDRVEFVAFDDYFKGRPKIDRLTVRAIPEASNITIALETGEIDATNWLTPGDLGKIEAAENLDYQLVSSPIFMLFGFNTDKEPFNDVRVRQAISMAINRDDITTVATEGLSKVARSFIPEGITGYHQSDKLNQNIAMAKQLLADSGNEGLGFTITVNDTKERRDIAQVIQANLNEIGVSVEIEVMEWAAYLNALSAGSYTAHIMGNYLGTDADYAVNRLWHTPVNANEVGGNYFRYSNPRVDQLIDQGMVTLDAAESEKIYTEINQILAADVPAIPLYWFNFNLCYNKRMKNMVAHRAGYLYVFDDIDKDNSM